MIQLPGNSVHVYSPGKVGGMDPLGIQNPKLLGPDGQPVPEFLIPHIQTFPGIVGGLTTYRWRHDEALRHSHTNALAMRRDTFIHACLQERYLAVAQQSWEIDPDNPEDPEQVEQAALETARINAIPDFESLLISVLEMIWYGRSATHKLYQECELGMCIEDHYPINGDKLVWTYQGVPGILIHSTASLPPDAEVIYSERNRAVLLRKPYYREQFIIARHQKQDSDFYEPDKAAQRFGTGMREYVYWYWWLWQEVMGWIIDYVEKVGLGVTIFYYEQGNKEAEERAKEAAKGHNRHTVLVLPRPIGGEKAGSAVERVEVPTSGAEFLLKIIESYFQDTIRLCINGQMLSARAQSTGMGSGVADFQANCVPAEGSEILTRDGFKSPEDVMIGEEVLAYDADTDTCVWTSLLDKTFFDDAPVQRMSVGRKKFNAVCTPDHSWAVEKTKYLSDLRGKIVGEVTTGLRGKPKPKNQKRYLKKSNEIGSRENIILAAPEVATEDSILTPTEAAILGWAVTDGHIRRNGNYVKIGICQSKEKNFDSIRELVVTLGAYEWSGKPFTRTFPNGRTYDCLPQHWWYLPVEAARNLVGKCRFNTREDLPKIVTRLSSPARKSMLEAMMLAEGCDRGTFANTDPYIMEAFEILCALEGLATGALLRNSKPPNDTCNVKRLKKTRYVHGDFIHREDAGSCRVWCPTTAYGTWVMRQGGRVMITGNTKSNITQSDSRRVEDILTRELVEVSQRWNNPKARGKYKLKFCFARHRPNADQAIAAARAIWEMGGDINEKELKGIANLTAGKPGQKMLTKLDPTVNPQVFQMQMQAQQAAAEAQERQAEHDRHIAAHEAQTKRKQAEKPSGSEKKIKDGGPERYAQDEPHDHSWVMKSFGYQGDTSIMEEKPVGGPGYIDGLKKIAGYRATGLASQYREGRIHYDELLESASAFSRRLTSSSLAHHHGLRYSDAMKSVDFVHKLPGVKGAWNAIVDDYANNSLSRGEISKSLEKYFHAAIDHSRLYTADPGWSPDDSHESHAVFADNLEDMGDLEGAERWRAMARSRGSPYYKEDKAKYIALHFAKGEPRRYSFLLTKADGNFSQAGDEDYIDEMKAHAERLAPKLVRAAAVRSGWPYHPMDYGWMNADAPFQWEGHHSGKEEHVQAIIRSSIKHHHGFDNKTAGSYVQAVAQHPEAKKAWQAFDEAAGKAFQGTPEQASQAYPELSGHLTNYLHTLIDNSKLHSADPGWMHDDSHESMAVFADNLEDMGDLQGAETHRRRARMMGSPYRKEDRQKYEALHFAKGEPQRYAHLPRGGYESTPDSPISGAWAGNPGAPHPTGSHGVWAPHPDVASGGAEPGTTIGPGHQMYLPGLKQLAQDRATLMSQTHRANTIGLRGYSPAERESILRNNVKHTMGRLDDHAWDLGRSSLVHHGLLMDEEVDTHLHRVMGSKSNQNLRGRVEGLINKSSPTLINKEFDEQLSSAIMDYLHGVIGSSRPPSGLIRGNYSDAGPRMYAAERQPGMHPLTSKESQSQGRKLVSTGETHPDSGHPWVEAYYPHTPQYAYGENLRPGHPKYAETLKHKAGTDAYYNARNALTVDGGRKRLNPVSPAGLARDALLHYGHPVGQKNFQEKVEFLTGRNAQGSRFNQIQDMLNSGAGHEEIQNHLTDYYHDIIDRARYPDDDWHVAADYLEERGGPGDMDRAREIREHLKHEITPPGELPDISGSSHFFYKGAGASGPVPESEPRRFAALDEDPRWKYYDVGLSSPFNDHPGAFHRDDIYGRGAHADGTGSSGIILPHQSGNYGVGPGHKDYGTALRKFVDTWANNRTSDNREAPLLSPNRFMNDLRTMGHRLASSALSHVGVPNDDIDDITNAVSGWNSAHRGNVDDIFQSARAFHGHYPLPEETEDKRKIPQDELLKRMRDNISQYGHRILDQVQDRADILDFTRQGEDFWGPYSDWLEESGRDDDAARARNPKTRVPGEIDIRGFRGARQFARFRTSSAVPAVQAIDKAGHLATPRPVGSSTRMPSAPASAVTPTSLNPGGVTPSATPLPDPTTPKLGPWAHGPAPRRFAAKKKKDKVQEDPGGLEKTAYLDGAEPGMHTAAHPKTGLLGRWASHPHDINLAIGPGHKHYLEGLKQTEGRRAWWMSGLYRPELDSPESESASQMKEEVDYHALKNANSALAHHGIGGPGLDVSLTNLNRNKALRDRVHSLLDNIQPGQMDDGYEDKITESVRNYYNGIIDSSTDFAKTANLRGDPDFWEVYSDWLEEQDRGEEANEARRSGVTSGMDIDDRFRFSKAFAKFSSAVPAVRSIEKSSHLASPRPVGSSTRMPSAPPASVTPTSLNPGGISPSATPITQTQTTTPQPGPWAPTQTLGNPAKFPGDIYEFLRKKRASQQFAKGKSDSGPGSINAHYNQLASNRLASMNKGTAAHKSLSDHIGYDWEKKINNYVAKRGFSDEMEAMEVASDIHTELMGGSLFTRFDETKFPGEENPFRHHLNSRMKIAVLNYLDRRRSDKLQTGFGGEDMENLADMADYRGVNPMLEAGRRMGEDMGGESVQEERDSGGGATRGGMDRSLGAPERGHGVDMSYVTGLEDNLKELIYSYVSKDPKMTRNMIQDRLYKNSRVGPTPIDNVDNALRALKEEGRIDYPNIPDVADLNDRTGMKSWTPEDRVYRAILRNIDKNIYTHTPTNIGDQVRGRSPIPRPMIRGLIQQVLAKYDFDDADFENKHEYGGWDPDEQPEQPKKPLPPGTEG